MDLISRQELLRHLSDWQMGEAGGSEAAYTTLGNVMEAVNNIPSAETEIVRCKECRFHENEQPGMVYCPAVVGGWVEDDWFCKGGERGINE